MQEVPENAPLYPVPALRKPEHMMGCRVSAVRPVRGIKKGARGTLKGLGKEALVPYFVPYFDHTLTW